MPQNNSDSLLTGKVGVLHTDFVNENGLMFITRLKKKRARNEKRA